MPPPPPHQAVAVAPGRTGVLRLIGNVLWLVLAGVWMALGYLVAGVLQCITIVGIPFGIQAFKLAGYALWPFGRVVVRAPIATLPPAWATPSGSCCPACGWRSAMSSPGSCCA